MRDFWAGDDGRMAADMASPPAGRELQQRHECPIDMSWAELQAAISGEIDERDGR